MFEDANTGLIPLIGQAKSPAALRKSTLFVLQTVYADEEPPDAFADFEDELSAILPDDLPPSALPKVAGVVAGMLRLIKDERIRREAVAAEIRAEAAARRRKKSAGNGKRGPSRSRNRWAPAQIIAAALALVVVAGGGAGAAYYYFFMDHGAMPGARVKKLVVEMELAKVGKGPATHEYGWPLTVEHRAGLIGVTAVGVPVEACTSAAWYFVNQPDSNIVINDRLPERVGPSALKRFCSEKGQNAKLLWLSKDPAAQAQE